MKQSASRRARSDISSTNYFICGLWLMAHESIRLLISSLPRHDTITVREATSFAGPMYLKLSQCPFSTPSSCPLARPNTRSLFSVLSAVNFLSIDWEVLWEGQEICREASFLWLRWVRIGEPRCLDGFLRLDDIHSDDVQAPALVNNAWDLVNSHFPDGPSATDLSRTFADPPRYSYQDRIIHPRTKPHERRMLSAGLLG